MGKDDNKQDKGDKKEGTGRKRLPEEDEPLMESWMEGEEIREEPAGWVRKAIVGARQVSKRTAGQLGTTRTAGRPGATKDSSGPAPKGS